MALVGYGVHSLISPPTIVKTSTPVSKNFKTLSNHYASLPSGQLIVEAFAPWCMYCATAAKWEDAKEMAWAHDHNMGFIMVDVSSNGGIGRAAKAPTIASILATGKDGSMIPLTSDVAIASNLQRFVRTYRLRIPVYFWPHGNPVMAWNIQRIPTFLYLDNHHQVMSRLVGFHTVKQFVHWATPFSSRR